MKHFLILFLLTLNCFGAGLTISSLDGSGTNLTVYGGGNVVRTNDGHPVIDLRGTVNIGTLHATNQVIDVVETNVVITGNTLIITNNGTIGGNLSVTGILTATASNLWLKGTNTVLFTTNGDSLKFFGVGLPSEFPFDIFNTDAKTASVLFSGYATDVGETVPTYRHFQSGFVRNIFHAAAFLEDENIALDDSGPIRAFRQWNGWFTNGDNAYQIYITSPTATLMNTTYLFNPGSVTSVSFDDGSSPYEMEINIRRLLASESFQTPTAFVTDHIQLGNTIQILSDSSDAVVNNGATPGISVGTTKVQDGFLVVSNISAYSNIVTAMGYNDSKLFTSGSTFSNCNGSWVFCLTNTSIHYAVWTNTAGSTNVIVFNDPESGFGTYALEQSNQIGHSFANFTEPFLIAPYPASPTNMYDYNSGAPDSTFFTGVTNPAVKFFGDSGSVGNLTSTNLSGKFTGTLVVTATNRLNFTTVSALTNTLGREATAIVTAGTSVALQDTNGNAIATIGTIATLDVLIPMHVNMRLSGTGVSAILY